MRHTLRVERAVEDGESDLPELTIRELTREEIKALRNAQVAEDGVAVA